MTILSSSSLPAFRMAAIPYAQANAQELSAQFNFNWFDEGAVKDGFVTEADIQKRVEQVLDKSGQSLFRDNNGELNANDYRLIAEDSHFGKRCIDFMAQGDSISGSSLGGEPIYNNRKIKSWEIVPLKTYIHKLVLSISTRIDKKIDENFKGFTATEWEAFLRTK